MPSGNDFEFVVAYRKLIESQRMVTW